MYIVVYSENYMDFLQEVNDKMACGYIPQGGIFIQKKDNEKIHVFFQAMVMGRV